MKIRLQNSPVICNAGDGETILTACARAGIILSAPCGGCGRCGKCKVKLLDGQAAGDIPDGEGMVHACKASPVTDITIFIPEDSALAGNEVSAAQQEQPVTGRVNNNKKNNRAAAALDIGTTTISANLIDLDTLQAIDTVSQLNDQRIFGADVMSRIGAARDGKTQELFNLINRQTEQILLSFQKKWNIPKIEKLAVSGNTTMLHFFLNVDPSAMGEIPFTPVFLEEKELKGAALSLSVENITVLPSIAAFIGGDITAGLAVLDILNSTAASLLVDIGTNGEMVLIKDGTIYCCSTAAGPAFEGAEISCGAGGIRGAISCVTIPEMLSDMESSLQITTIGNAPPIGVCGSGLVDAVAVMLKLGIIDETGRMEDLHKEFVISPGISITGADIRQFQLAKSAILSGVKILCKNAGLGVCEVKNVYIAGGLGFFINKQNAVNTGILPKEFLPVISVCGNLSLQGAQQCLTNENFLEKCRQIIDKCSVVELASDPAFMDEFTENLLFD